MDIAMTILDPQRVLLSGAFDAVDAKDIRLLDQASRLGPVHIYLWDDATTTRLNRQAPRHPLEERLYFIKSMRYVEAVTIANRLTNRHTLPDAALTPGATWVVSPGQHTFAKDAYCQAKKLGYRVVSDLATTTASPAQP